MEWSEWIVAEGRSSRQEQEAAAGGRSRRQWQEAVAGGSGNGREAGN